MGNTSVILLFSYRKIRRELDVHASTSAPCNMEYIRAVHAHVLRCARRKPCARALPSQMNCPPRATWTSHTGKIRSSECARRAAAVRLDPDRTTPETAATVERGMSQRACTRAGSMVQPSRGLITSGVITDDETTRDERATWRIETKLHDPPVSAWAEADAAGSWAAWDFNHRGVVW
jgi:hypothetical protein